MDFVGFIRKGAFRGVYSILQPYLKPIDRMALMSAHPRFVFLENEHTKELQGHPLGFQNLWFWIRTLCADDFCSLFVPPQHSVRNLLAARVLENKHVCPERMCFRSNISWLRLLTGKVECTCEENMCHLPLVDGFNHLFPNPTIDPNALRVYNPGCFVFFDFHHWLCTRVDDEKRLFLSTPVYVPMSSSRKDADPIAVLEKDSGEVNKCLVAECVARYIWRSGSESRQFDFWSLWYALRFNHRANRHLRNVFPAVSSLSRRISSLSCPELFQQFLPNDHPFRISVQEAFTGHLNQHHSTELGCGFWKCPNECYWMHMMSYDYGASRSTMLQEVCRCHRHPTPSYGHPVLRQFTCVFPDFEPRTQEANGTLERTSMSFPFKPADPGWMSCPAFIQKDEPHVLVLVHPKDSEPSTKKRRNQ